MKKISLFLLFCLIPLFCVAQTDSTKLREITYVKYLSNSGSRIKFVDKKLSKIYYTDAYTIKLECTLRVLIENEVFYHYFIVLEDSKDYTIIEYNDFKQIVKALKLIEDDFSEEANYTPDYYENKYLSEDRFLIGYYRKEKKSRWFFRLYDGIYFQTGYHEFKSIDSFSQGLNKIYEEAEALINSGDWRQR